MSTDTFMDCRGLGLLAGAASAASKQGGCVRVAGASRYSPHRFATGESPAWAKVSGLRTAVFSWSLSLVGQHLLRVVDGAVDRRLGHLQRTAAAEAAAPAAVEPVRARVGLPVQDAAELAVEVSRLRVHGRVEHLPASAWLTGVETGRCRPFEHWRRGQNPGPDTGTGTGTADGADTVRR